MSSEVDNWAERMRLCLFRELGIGELYESGGINRCTHLQWSEVEVFGDQWMVAKCSRDAKRRKTWVGGKEYNLCEYACTTRKGSGPMRGFFREVCKRVREWRRTLIYDQLNILEERQCQRPVRDLIISL